MKVVIGIVLISLVILGLIAYMILMLNAREMIFCGDLKNENGTNAQITRVYTTDLNANETLSEIIVKMNESDTESVQKSDITEVLAQYQNIIYAPVFTISVTQADSSTYIIDGQVLNGLDENGDPGIDHGRCYPLKKDGGFMHLSDVIGYFKTFLNKVFNDHSAFSVTVARFPIFMYRLFI